MNEEVTLKCYTIDDKDYLVIKEAEYNGADYLYLANEADSKDLMVRKVVGDYLEELDSEEELYEVLKLFSNVD